jgi:hypothetical protein
LYVGTQAHQAPTNHSKKTPSGKLHLWLWELFASSPPAFARQRVCVFNIHAADEW